MKVDAERWARKVEAELDRGVFQTKDDAALMTLRAALERYGREVTPLKRGALIEQSRIKALARHPLSMKMLASIRSTDIACFRDERRAASKSASTIAKEMGLVSAVFRTAIAEWGVTGLSNPVVGVRKPPQPNGRQRRLFPGEEELLLRAFRITNEVPTVRDGCSRNPWVLPILVLALETAARRREILELKWSDIDLDKRVAHLRITKSGIPRLVPLSMRAAQTLHRLPRQIDDRVFPITVNSFKLAFERGLARALRLYRQETADPDPRMLRGLRLHDLRHEAASRLAERLNVLELAAITGHQDLSCLKRYHHPRAEHLVAKIG